MRVLKHLASVVLFTIVTTAAFAEKTEEDSTKFSEAELEQILAPIALYPDTVLSHILIAATYPLEVIQAERWTSKNTELKGSDAVKAVKDKNWDLSIKALVAFPQILTRMSENLQWTQKLGDAFLQNEKQLLASIQSLRRRANEAGNLDKMEKVAVTHDDNSIIIEPKEPEVVYVPYYDTRVVYGPWNWSHYPPVYWSYPHNAGYYAGLQHDPFYWGPRAHLSYGFFFNSFLWNEHQIVRIPFNHYRPSHYYNRHQIAGHRYAQPWAHNPTHRRGVSYRSVSVSHRYRSQNPSHRPSRSEVRSHRNTRNHTVGANNANHNQQTRRNNNSSHRTQIASPDRIREELRDGRISVQERNSRPQRSNHGSTNNRGQSNHNQNPAGAGNRSETGHTTPPVQAGSRNNHSNNQSTQHRAPRSQNPNHGTSGSEHRSNSNRSSSSNHSNSSSSHSSGSNRSNHSGGRKGRKH